MENGEYVILKGMTEFTVITNCDGKGDVGAEQYFNRGMAKYMLANYKGAIKDYNKAIKFNPNKSEYYYNRGMAKDKLGDSNGYKEDFNKSYELILKGL